MVMVSIEEKTTMEIKTLFILDTSGSNLSRVAAWMDGQEPVSISYDNRASLSDNHKFALNFACDAYGLPIDQWQADSFSRSDFSPVTFSRRA